MQTAPASAARRQPITSSRFYRLLLTLALAFSSAVLCAAEIRIGGTGSALAGMRLLGQEFSKAHPDINVSVMPSLGSGGGIKAVLAGKLEIAVTSRPLEQKERAQGLTEIQYAKTPFVFAVALANKVSAINTQEIADIYAGRRDKWPDGTKIRLVLRPQGESDSELIKSISPAVRDAKANAETRPGMLFAITDQDTAEHLEKIAGAFGATTLAQIITEKRTLKPLRLNGVAPTTKALADGTYSLHKPLFMVLPRAASPIALQFVAFMQSTAAREILLKTGHLPVASR